MKLLLSLLAAFFLLSPAPLRADLNSPTGATLTVKAGDLLISADDIAFTQKTGYVHLMFNAAPYLKAQPDLELLPVVQALLETEGRARFPGAKLFKVDVADISARDDYGLPAWDKITLIERFKAEASKKGLRVSRVKKAA